MKYILVLIISFLLFSCTNDNLEKLDDNSDQVQLDSNWTWSWWIWEWEWKWEGR